MKQLKYSILALSCATAFVTACNDEHEYFDVPRPADEMHVKGTSDSLSLSKDNPDATAITFTWDATSNPEDPNDSPTYGFVLFKTGAAETTSIDFIDLGSTREISFTNLELNNYSVKWGQPGSVIKVTARVVARFHSDLKYVYPESSTFDFKIVPYERFPKNIYLNLKPEDGSDLQQIKLNQRSGTYIYETNAKFSVGSFWFTLDENPNSYPAYGKGADNNKVKEFKSGEIVTIPLGTASESQLTIDLDAETYSMFEPLRLYKGFKATAATAGDYAKLLDGNKDTKWDTGLGDGGLYIEFEAEDPIIPTRYDLTTGNDNTDWNGRNPRDWVIKGKLNADDEWTDFVTVKDDAVLEDKNFETYSFKIDNPQGPFKYFRFEIQSVKADGGTGWFQLSELELYTGEE